MKPEGSTLPDLSHIGNKYREKTKNLKNVKISKTLKASKPSKHFKNRNRQHYKTAIAKIFNDSDGEYYFRSDLKLGVESMVTGFDTEVFSEALREMISLKKLFKIRLNDRPAISLRQV